MPILNYSTQVAVTKTVGEIQALLAKHGAKSILIDYDGQGQPVALAFLLATPHGERGFKLPARVEAVWQVLRGGTPYVPPRLRTREHAARVAWRVLKSWLEAQLALIQTEMVSVLEVLLPYMQVEGNVTVYERLEGQRFQLALPPVRSA